jgi:PAS domain S-box-containing protein
MTWPPREVADLSAASTYSAIEGALYGAIAFAPDGAILFANRAASAIFACETSELAGQPLDSILPSAQYTSDAEPLGITRQTLTGVRKDGGLVPLEVGFHIVGEGEARYIVASIVDLTERLNLEARLAAATHEQLGFQRLVSDIAARFVGIDLGEVDAAIVDSLRQIAEALQLDRSVLWRKQKDEDTCVATHYWVAPPLAMPGPVDAASIPGVIAKLEAGEIACYQRVDDVADPVDRETFRRHGPRSGVAVPLALDSHRQDVLGALAFASMTTEREWPPAIVERLRLVAGVVSQALARKASQVELEKALAEIHQLRNRLTDENVELRREVKMMRAPRLIVSESPVVKRAFAQVEQVAPTPATVLLLGETGSGKEVFAQAIHDLSPRHQRQMIRVSCAAIPSALIESELFGRERGAYTGALSRQIGRFEAANQSTLFLDEIGELQPEMQVKLLRVLQEKVIERLGNPTPVKVDVRIIAATNRDLDKAVLDNAFRQDLYYRLNVFPIVVPPLRERVEDIPGLVWAFIDEFSQSFGKRIEAISKESMRELQRYAWPGNVRELRNVIERAVILATGHQLVVPTPRPSTRAMPQSAMTLVDLEVDHIRGVLESTNWRVRGPGGAAERLGLKPTTLESRMAKLGIARKKTS